MPAYSYKARNASGTPVSGVLEAMSEDDLLRQLSVMKYLPVKVEVTLPAQAPDTLALFSRGKFKTREIVMMNMKLAYLSSAGIPILNSLRVLAEQMTNPVLKSAMESIAQKVFEGYSLSDAMAAHPRIFSPMYISMIRVGEVGGTLDVVLNRLALYLEQEESLRQKVSSALFYPLIMFVLGCAVLVLIITFVIPQFVDIFEKSGVALPLPTLIIYQAGNFFKSFWLLMAVSGAVVSFAVRNFFVTPRGKNIWDHAVLRLPGIGPLMREFFVIRLTRGMGILLDSGVGILKSFEAVADVVDNNVYRQLIVRVRGSIEKGEKISHRLKESEFIPSDVVSMVATGEETGKLAPMFNRVADFYEIAVDHSVKKLTMLVEPLFIMVIGSLVGVIMASMLLPLFDMVKTIQN